MTNRDLNLDMLNAEFKLERALNSITKFQFSPRNLSFIGLVNTHILIWPIPTIWSDQYPHFGLYGLANSPYFGPENKQVSDCPEHTFRFARAGQYHYFGLACNLFGLTKSLGKNCPVWLIVNKICLVRPTCSCGYGQS